MGTLLPALGVAVLVAYAAFYAVFRSWLDYRTKVSFIKELDRHASLPSSPDAMASLLAQAADSFSRRSRHNFLLTGLILSFVGLSTFLAGRSLRVGQLAVGLYIGGKTCMVLGLLLAVFGLVALLVRHRLGPDRPEARPASGTSAFDPKHE